MKVRINYGNVQLEGEGETHKDVFRQLAAMTEVFREESCGHCNKNISVLRVRNVQDPKNNKKTYEYFERQCIAKGCGAKLSYGQHSEGGSLFPKRKDENGNPLENHGWVKYEKKDK